MGSGRPSTYPDRVNITCLMHDTRLCQFDVKMTYNWHGTKYICKYKTCHMFYFNLDYEVCMYNTCTSMIVCKKVNIVKKNKLTEFTISPGPPILAVASVSFKFINTSASVLTWTTKTCFGNFKKQQKQH